MGYRQVQGGPVQELWICLVSGTEKSFLVSLMLRGPTLSHQIGMHRMLSFNLESARAALSDPFISGQFQKNLCRLPCRTTTSMVRNLERRRAREKL